MAVIHFCQRVMVDVILQLGILDLQFFFRFLQCFSKTLYLKMCLQNISVLEKYQHTQYRTHYYQQYRGR
ncbi:hypothetical protein D3C76_1611200 [compost metagenome]